jgi:hypothetical protein
MLGSTTEKKRENARIPKMNSAARAGPAYAEP